MNLDLIRSKKETEDLLLSITTNCETFNNQTDTKPHETLVFEMTKPSQTFHSNPPTKLKEDWMIGLLDLEVYNSIFNITKENSKFELNKLPYEKAGGISYEKVRDDIEKDSEIPNITASDLQDEIMGPIINKEYREQVTERMEDVGQKNILAGYHSSFFSRF